ncbi:MAG: hypothetical protein K6T16_02455, partial [Candidatus Pacearchaeota archaeon]|nr:hypothetical protein [Candidatus Pacearchaeota archaeon]
MENRAKMRLEKAKLYFRISLAVFILAIALSLSSVAAQQTTQQTTQQTIEELTYTAARTEYLYPNAGLSPWTQAGWDDSYCNKTGMDFLVELMPEACSPAVVRSDLLEEQDVPVFCRLTGVKINPIIQVPYIKKIIPAVENKSAEVLDVTFLPARHALSYYASSEQKRPAFEGTPTMSNLGYLWIHLKRQPVEEKMPDKAVVNMSVRIVYDVTRTYGINEHQFILPLLDNEEWQTKYKNYGFWRGKGYLRLQEIEGNNNAKIAIYTNPNQPPYAVRSLRAGVDPLKKDEILLPGFYCGAGVSLKLDEISVPKNHVRLIVNGDELVVGEGEKIQDSGCVVYNIEPSPYSYGGSVVLGCGGQEKKVLTLKDFRVIVEVDGKEREVSTGSEIAVEKEGIKKHMYVGFLGREYTKEGLEDTLVIFIGKNPKAELSEKAVKTTTETIHRYVTEQRGESLATMSHDQWDEALKEELEKRDENVAKQIGRFYIVKKGVA